MRILLLSILILTASITYAQKERNETPDPPKTKLESFMGQNGVVIVQGFTTIGTVRGLYDTYVSVDSKEFSNASTGKREAGITILVHRSLGTGSGRENTSYVDYDEIESLIKGLDYISKVDYSSTKLADFQASYSTKDDLSLATFSSTSSGLFSKTTTKTTMFTVESGTIGKVGAFFKQEDIKQVRDLIVKAKEKLDSIK